ncbi:MAG: lysylphosphatidylglycerol synthase transmembrane domain-containing protein [Methanobacteriota archaeon]
MNLKKLLPIVGVVIFFYILSTLNIGKILAVFSSLNPWYVLVSFGSIIPIILLVNVEWHLILRKHGIRVGFSYSLKNIFIGYFYGFVTPGGFGGYTRALYLKDESGASLRKCIVDILLFNTVDYLSLLCFGVAGGFMLGNRVPGVFPVIVVLFLVFLSVTVVLIRKDLGRRLIHWVFQARLLAALREKWLNHVDALYAELPRVKDLVLPFCLSLVGWWLWFSILYLVAPWFMIQVPYLWFLMIVAVANVIASVPISIYGLGTREAALIGLLSLFGVARENVIGFSLFWFVLSWLLPSIVGAVVTFVESKRHVVGGKARSA